MKMTVHIILDLAKPDITGSDFDAVKAWIKTNIIDKLPENVSATYTFTGTS
jgi:hypothetical protein